MGYTALRAKCYLDYWNLQTLVWETISRSTKLNWRILGHHTAQTAAGFCPEWANLTCGETEVFASVPPDDLVTCGAAMHMKFLRGLAAPGTRVHLAHRHVQSKTCPTCQGVIQHTVEKGVDASLFTMVVEDFLDGRLDAVILGTQDRDFIPIVQFLQRRGIPVINLGGADGGHALAETCDALVTIHELLDRVIYTPYRQRALLEV